jgi:hypothetical protein
MPREAVTLLLLALAAALVAVVAALVVRRDRRVRRAASQDAICAVCRNPLRLQWVLDFDGLDDGPGVSEIWRHDFEPVHPHEPEPRRWRARA